MSIEKTHTQLPLEGVGADPNQPPKLPPVEPTEPRTDPKKEYHRRYYQEHKQQWKEYNKAEYRRNIDRYRRNRGTKEYRDKLAAYLKGYRAEKPEKLKELMRRWVAKNKEYIRQYRKDYGPRRLALYQINKEAICARTRELSKTEKYRKALQNRRKRRRTEDVQFFLKERIRSTMNRAFRREWVKKPARTEALLGCTIAEAKAHLESRFVNGMSWQNRSSWHIDHFVPISAFDLRDAEEVRWCFNYRNLQPLSGRENLLKQDTIPNPLPDWLPAHIADRILQRTQ